MATEADGAPRYDDRGLIRYRFLRPHLEDGIPLARLATGTGVSLRTAERWLAQYRQGGVAALQRSRRVDRERRRMPAMLQTLIEGLALRRPAPAVSVVYREAADAARQHGWSVPSYSTVYSVISALTPAMVMLAQEGDKRYRDVFDLVYRREAQRSNAIWQADHTPLDIWVVTASGKPVRPWLTTVIDDHSRAVSGYTVGLDAPSSINTALTLRQAIWRKTDPAWQICGIPDVLYTDNGSDFTSHHLEQVAADLKIRLVFSTPGHPRGRGKSERFFNTVNQLCLARLPGYAPEGTPNRTAQARLTLTELDAAIGRFIVDDYHCRTHSETGEAPRARWEKGEWLPRMPESLEQLDLLLLTVAKERKVHPDGIYFQGLRYLDPTLAAFVGEAVTVRYDPRDVSEVRVFHKDRFLCRAVSPEVAATTITLRDLMSARNKRRRDLRNAITDRTRLVDELVALRRGPKSEPVATATPATVSAARSPRLKRYRNE